MSDLLVEAYVEEQLEAFFEWLSEEYGAAEVSDLPPFRVLLDRWQESCAASSAEDLKTEVAAPEAAPAASSAEPGWTDADTAAWTAFAAAAFAASSGETLADRVVGARNAADSLLAELHACQERSVVR